MDLSDHETPREIVDEEDPATHLPQPPPPTPTSPFRVVEPQVTEHVVRSEPPSKAMDKEKIKLSDRIMLLATIMIALGTIVSAAAVVSQWREMLASGRQTD